MHAQTFIDLDDYLITNDSTEYAYNKTQLKQCFSASKPLTFKLSQVVWIDSIVLNRIDSVEFIGTHNATFRLKLPENIHSAFFWLNDCSEWSFDNITFDCRNSKYAEDQWALYIRNNTRCGRNFKFDNCTFIDQDFIPIDGTYRPWCTEGFAWNDNTLINSTTLFWNYDSSRYYHVEGTVADSGECMYLVKGLNLCYSTITGNHGRYTGDSGIYLENSHYNIIERNIIEAAGKDAIKITGVSSYNNIKDNVVNGAGFAITNGGIGILDKGDYTVIKDNAIYYKLGTVTQQYAITLDGSYTTVINNNAYGNFDKFIYYRSCNDVRSVIGNHHIQ